MMTTPVSDGSVSKRPTRKRAPAKSYDESLMDEEIDMQIGAAKKKKKGNRNLEKETATEAMIALSLGFPIDELLPQEIRAGVVSGLGGKEQNDYIVVRNHILTLWRSNVGIWLSKGQIRETVSIEYEQLMTAAYEFLLNNGYINFGVLPSFLPQISEEGGSLGSVIIVGAGLAGLGAARQLMSFGFRVLILEGRNRPGGRVYTEKMGEGGNVAAVDMGGSVITGIHANPLGVLARQLNIPLHKVRTDCPLYRPDGSPVDKDVDRSVELIFNKLLDKVTQFRQALGGYANQVSLGSVLEKLRRLYAVARTDEEKQLLDWHFANLEYANAGCLSQLSAAYWDQDDPYEMGGDHCFLAGANWRIVRALCKDVPIMYGQTVETIRYNADGVQVVSGDQVYEADMVLCTVPLGVLKKGAIKFEPELPPRKLAAIDRLGFGLLNKVAMLFPRVFWGEELDTFGCLNESSEKRGEFFLFYGYHTVSGGAVLVALVAGEAAQSFEETDPAIELHRVLEVLRGIYAPKGIDVPDPIQSVCTRWSSDPFSYGSYSHVQVQSSGKDYDILSETVGNRLFFGGEATIREHPATMHGAYLSGLREASRMLQATKARQNYPGKYTQKSAGLSNEILAELFKKPDIVSGNLLFVFNPLNEEPKSAGILQVTLEDSKAEAGDEKDPDQNLHLYAVMSREQAQELLQQTGGIQGKLLHLFGNLRMKLMGSSGLGTLGSSVATSILTARRGKRRNRVAAAAPETVLGSST